MNIPNQDVKASYSELKKIVYNTLFYLFLRQAYVYVSQAGFELYSGR